jgi:hypothetical protein
MINNISCDKQLSIIKDNIDKIYKITRDKEVALLKYYSDLDWIDKERLRKLKDIRITAEAAKDAVHFMQNAIINLEENIDAVCRIKLFENENKNENENENVNKSENET